MTALAGREGCQPWDLKENEGDDVVNGTWIRNLLRVGTNTSLSRSMYSLDNPEGIDADGAKGVREIAIISQGCLLSTLLGDGNEV